MYELDKRKFGAFVAQLRKEKQYTQKELAARLMISDKAISKWETGVTIPDTALLIPLADLLGVTVTELLTGERMERQPMQPEAVERIVKTAIHYTEAAPVRAWREKSRWRALYILACLANLACLLLLYRAGRLTEPIYTSAILAALFGAYFCFLVPMKLPGYYDQNKISGICDGAVRMHIPGLYFNNRNWPYIVEAGRAALIVNLAGLPLLALVLGGLFPQLWSAAENYVMLAMLLGGLFVPMYLVGKRHE